MRTVEELIRDTVDREEMTYEEEKAFVDYWFDVYERTGFTEKFNGVYDSVGELDGRAFEVLGRQDEDGEFDLCAMPVWTIKLDNGEITHAFPEEICKLEVGRGIYCITYKGESGVSYLVENDSEYWGTERVWVSRNEFEYISKGDYNMIPILFKKEEDAIKFMKNLDGYEKQESRYSVRKWLGELEEVN